MWRLVVAGLLVAGVAQARTPAPVPCPGVSFVAAAPLLAGTVARVLVVDTEGQVAIPGLCDPVLARWRARRAGTQLRAKWTACGTATRVRLRMLYDAPDCRSATGVLRARRTPRTDVTAVPSHCGDDILDVSRGEACELSTPCAPAGTHCVDCACVPGVTTTTTPAGGTTTTTLAGLFEAPNPWNQDVSDHPVADESAAIIGALGAAGGWGNGNKLQIDFGFHLLHVDPTTPYLTFAKRPDYTSPDCDEPFPVPLPAGGAIEGQGSYTCAVDDEDCHLLVVDAAAKRLYELYDTSLDGGTLATTCGLFWDLTKSYPPNLRGEQCTSADAAGFPIGAMLFTADEVAAGEIPHAIRFILPNERMRAGVYVHPASHAGGPSGGESLPPYGVRFRLRPDFPLATLPSDGARVIARAMQKYGMFLSDGGNIALTAASDAYTAHTWDEVGIDSHSLFGIAVTDMQVVDFGPTVPLTYDCVRNP
jgi:hypothetical protein